MTEQSIDNLPYDPEKSPAGELTETFVNAVSTTYLRCEYDFVKFCELLDLKADKYGQEKWRLFNELVERLNNLDLQTLKKIVAVGFPTSELPVDGKPPASVEPPPLVEPPPPASSNETSP